MTRRVLLIGGMDSSGRAGILRDLEALRAVGAEARVAVTAVTAQGSRGVTALHPVPASVVTAQITAAEEVTAVKIGMLGTGAIVRAVAAALPAAPIVLDPVLIASSGATLLAPDGQQALMNGLLPQVTLLTPNLPELATLAPAGPEALLSRGCAAVLVKGGHATGPMATDTLFRPGHPPRAFATSRDPGRLRGTGCFLASAIAGGLACGLDLAAAIGQAKALMTRQFTAAAPPR